MPDMSQIEPNPDFKPTNAAERAAFADVQKQGRVKTTIATAKENVLRGYGMWRMVSKGSAAEKTLAARVAAMSDDELRVALLTFGIKTEKQMKRADYEKLVADRLSKIDM